MEHEITAADVRKLPSAQCAKCRERGQTWSGSAPTCSFPNGGEFSPDGWNCATAGGIREICGKPWDEPHSKADVRYLDDQWMATIDVADVDLDTGSAYALWVSWYKNRGRTEAMWLLSADETPRRPTEADCTAIIDALAKSR